jgi:hypothetical protein
MAHDRCHRDPKGDRCGNHERNWCQGNSLVEAVQPVAHHPPGDRPGDNVGDDHGPAELPNEQPDDIPRPRAQHLADADFLRPPLRGERSKAEQPKAADDDGEQRESGENLRPRLFGVVKLANNVLTELRLERNFRRELFPFLLNGRSTAPGSP